MMKYPQLWMPASCAQRSACSTCAGSIPFRARRKTASLPDSIPQEIHVQPAWAIARNISGSTKSTRLLHVHGIRKLRSRINAHIPITCSRLTVKMSAYM